MARKKSKTVTFTEQEFILDNIQLFQNTVLDKKANNGKGAFVSPPYKRFIQLSGAPGAEVNRLVAAPYSKGLHFGQITPAQLSLLVPKMKIYKMLSDGSQIQFPFNTIQTVDSITNSLEGRGTAVSLKSIQTRDEGKHTESQKNQSGVLKLYCQSLEAFFMTRPGGIRFSDLIHTQHGGGTYPSQGEILAADVVRRSPIKIEIGWEVPDDSNSTLFNSSELKTIRALKHVILMQSYEYEIDLQESGEIEISINFTGNLDSASQLGAELDLFFATDNSIHSQVVTSEKDRLARQLKEDRKTNTGAMVSEEAVQKEKKRTQAGIQHVLSGLNSVSAKDAWVSLFTIMESLNFNEASDDEDQGGRVFYMDLPEIALEAYVNAKREMAKKTKEKQLGFGLLGTVDELRKMVVKSIYKSVKRSKNHGKKQASSSPIAEAQNIIKKAGNDQKSMDDMQKEWGKAFRSSLSKGTKAGERRINFFFLGDLIEAALTIIHDRPEIGEGCPPSLSVRRMQQAQKMWDKVRVILGTIDIKNPLTQERHTMSLADLPISFSTFQMFWEEVVWSENKLNYPLPMFLTDVCQTLVPYAFKNCMFGGKPLGTSDKATLYRFRMPAGDILNEVWKKGMTKNISFEEITEARWERSSEEEGSRTQYKEYMLLQGDTIAPQMPTRANDIATRLAYNSKHSVPTFYIGNNKGLLKSVRFIRNGLPPGMVAENIIKNADNSAGNLAMAGLYTCRIEMFGNPLILNGMYVYINPRSLGIPDSITEDIAGGINKYIWASNVGLGGYYLVNQVTHTLDSRGYTTSFLATPENALLGFEKWSNTQIKKMRNAVKKPIS